MSLPERGFTPDTFDSQFDQQAIDEAVDISPEKPTGRPILFVLGWNTKLAEYKQTVKKIVVSGGKRVFSIEQQGSEEEKARALIEVINLKGFEEVDIISHSLGAIAAEIAALQVPDRIRRMVLINPPTKEKDPRNVIRQYNAMLSIENIKSKMDVGGRRIVAMANVIASFDTEMFSNKLRSLGTEVTIIHGIRDVLFPPPLTAKELDEENLHTPNAEYLIDGAHTRIDSFIGPALRFLKS